MALVFGKTLEVGKEGPDEGNEGSGLVWDLA